MAKKQQKPEEQAISPISNTAPPTEHRFKPGQSGNPNGRKSAGATIKEWMNSLAESGLTEDGIKQVARNKSLPWTKRAAAERILRTLESGDIADFTKVLKGEKTLEDLRSEGMNTEVVKKYKVGRDGITLELHDRAGNDFDRIMDRTDGKPGQTVIVTGEDGGPIQSEQTVKHVIDYDTIRSDLATFARTGPHHGGVPSNGNGKSVHSEEHHAN